MSYKVNLTIHKKNGSTVKQGGTASDFQLGMYEGLDAIKYLPEGKSRYKWIQIPNDYQMNNYYDSFDLTVVDSETGKELFSKHL